MLCTVLFTFICLWGNVVPFVSSTAALSLGDSVVEQEHHEQGETDKDEGEMVEEVCLEDALPIAETIWFIANSKPPVPHFLAMPVFSDLTVETPPPEV